MHSTKTDILALLKRSDGSTVDELAVALGLASMTVRQHLTALERDGVVLAAEVRRPTGRPHYRFRLTEAGHRRVSNGHDRMLTLLVDQAGKLEATDVADASPEERRAVLFRLAALALAQRHRAEVRALPPMSQIERVSALLREHGGFAEWHEIAGIFEIRDFGCVFRSTVASAANCAWHETFLSAMLDADVSAAEEPAECAACCRYTVTMKGQSPVSNGRQGHI